MNQPKDIDRAKELGVTKYPSVKTVEPFAEIARPER
jgi:hypothetical protein